MMSLIDKLNASPIWVSFNVHCWFAATVVYHVAKAANMPVAFVATTVLALAAAKEYWYDAKYETPPQTFGGSTVDFLSYAVGVVLAVIFTASGV